MIKKAEEKAKSNGARILQCTIRHGNTESERAFLRNDYKKVSEFYYPVSGNIVAVWQKVVSIPKNAAEQSVHLILRRAQDRLGESATPAASISSTRGFEFFLLPGRVHAWLLSIG